MKKHYLLRSLLFLLALFSMQMSYGAYVKGGRAYFSNLKAGDKIILRNASCDAGSDQYLNGNSSTANHWGYGDRKVMAVQTVEDENGAFTDDFIFELEDAGADEKTGNKTFYFKNVANGKYMKLGNLENLAMWDLLCNADSPDDATAFEPDSASHYCKWYSDPDSWNPNFATTQLDDTTMTFNHTSTIQGNDYLCHMGAWWTYGTVYYGAADDNIVWNVYYAVEDNSAKAQLSELVTVVNAEIFTYHTGNNPGDYNEDDFVTLQDAFADAQAMLEEEHSNEEFQDALNTLKEAFDKAQTTVTPLTDGYYNIVSAFPKFLTAQSVEKAMTMGGEHKLAWATLDQDDPLQLFKITKTDDGNYTIQNASMEEYIKGTQENKFEAQVYSSLQPETPQTITELGKTA